MNLLEPVGTLDGLLAAYRPAFRRFNIGYRASISCVYHSRVDAVDDGSPEEWHKADAGALKM